MTFANLSAVKLRLILSCLLFVTTAIGVGVFYFATSMLSNVADEVSKTTANANASQNNLQTLQKIESDLKTQGSVISRAQNVVANSQSYQYQNQIINDLNHYAKRSGITLTNIDFAAATSKTPATPTQPASGSGGSRTSSTPSAGMQTANISVTLQNPVSYTRLLRFMQSIEQNLTKMQIANISLSRDQSGVSSDVLNITVYVR